MNNISIENLDKICKKGSKPIDSIVVKSGVMDYVEGCELLSYNKIVEIDYRAHMIDVNIDKYFNEEFNKWNKINYMILNPARRSYRKNS